MSKKNKFMVGQSYVHFSWFTGGRMLYVVDAIKDGKVFMNTEDVELDGVHNRVESYDIQVDENGNEFVVLFNYRGADCKIYADKVEEGKSELLYGKLLDYAIEHGAEAALALLVQTGPDNFAGDYNMAYENMKEIAVYQKTGEMHDDELYCSPRLPWNVSD